MPIFLIALQDILTDADNPVDLTALPEAEVVANLQYIYRFMGMDVDVQIDDGVAVISLPGEKIQHAKQALLKTGHALKLAGLGHYQQAIPLFEDALKALPEHTEAQRNLVMAQMEPGNFKAAKQHVMLVLQLGRKDACPYLLLSNIYIYGETDSGSAERYYSSAYDQYPDDRYILTPYAGLRVKRGDIEGSISLFERVLDRDQANPSSRYSLPLALTNTSRLDKVLAELLLGFALLASTNGSRERAYNQDLSNCKFPKLSECRHGSLA